MHWKICSQCVADSRQNAWGDAALCYYVHFATSWLMGRLLSSLHAELRIQGSFTRQDLLNSPSVQPDVYCTKQDHEWKFLEIIPAVRNVSRANRTAWFSHVTLGLIRHHETLSKGSSSRTQNAVTGLYPRAV